jgi:hypothetical protein
MSVVCCQVEVSAPGRSLIQKSPIEWDVCEYDREASIMRRSWPTGGCWAMEGNIYLHYIDNVIIYFQSVLPFTAEKVKIQVYMYPLIMKMSIRNSRNILQ